MGLFSSGGLKTQSNLDELQQQLWGIGNNRYIVGQEKIPKKKGLFSKIAGGTIGGMLESPLGRAATAVVSPATALAGLTGAGGDFLYGSKGDAGGGTYANKYNEYGAISPGYRPVYEERPRYGLGDWLVEQIGPNGEGFNTKAFAANSSLKPGEQFEWVSPWGSQGEQDSTKFAQQQFEQNVAPAQERYYREKVLPSIKEAYAQNGTFSGTDRARAEADAAQKFQETQGQQIADWSKYGAEQYQKQYLQEQMMRFEEMKRTNPVMSPLMDKIMAAMGMTTQQSFVEPAGPGWGIVSGILQGGASALGSYLGKA